MVIKPHIVIADNLISLILFKLFFGALIIAEILGGKHNDQYFTMFFRGAIDRANGCRSVRLEYWALTAKFI